MDQTSQLWAPPWLRYPHIPLGAAGWRMGAGESYLMQWSQWLESLPAAAQQQYRAWFPPPPQQRDFYDPGFGLSDRAEYWATCPSGYLVQHWRAAGRPRYSREQLVAAGYDGQFVPFWKPNADVVGPESCCQWQPTPFHWFGSYRCAEQYLMAEKARVFGDDAKLAQIMDSDDPGHMRKLGRQVRNFDAGTWDAVKYSIVLTANYAKFTQHPQLREYLLSTTGSVLVEASPLDTVWGIGFSQSSVKAYEPEQWRGQNLLGFALMEVRDAIARVYANVDRLDPATVG